MLLRELNDALMSILGHNGTSHIRLEDFRREKAFFLVGYDGETPVCCAGVRMFDGETGEIQRVYARSNRAGAGAALMKALEEQARELGYRRILLECREGNAHAIGFYLKNGYVICENYPPYDSEADAVCFEKKL